MKPHTKKPNRRKKTRAAGIISVPPPAMAQLLGLLTLVQMVQNLHTRICRLENHLIKLIKKKRSKKG